MACRKSRRRTSRQHECDPPHNTGRGDDVLPAFRRRCPDDSQRLPKPRAVHADLIAQTANPVTSQIKIPWYVCVGLDRSAGLDAKWGPSSCSPHPDNLAGTGFHYCNIAKVPQLLCKALCYRSLAAADRIDLTPSSIPRVIFDLSPALKVPSSFCSNLSLVSFIRSRRTVSRGISRSRAMVVARTGLFRQPSLVSQHCWRTMVAFHRPSQSRNKAALTRVYLIFGLGAVPQKETNENSAAAPE